MDYLVTFSCFVVMVMLIPIPNMVHWRHIQRSHQCNVCHLFPVVLHELRGGLFSISASKISVFPLVPWVVLSSEQGRKPKLENIQSVQREMSISPCKYCRLKNKTNEFLGQRIDDLRK